MARSDLAPRFVSNYLELAAPSLCELVCGLVSCPMMASSAQHVLLPLLIELLFGCAFMRCDRTLMCPCAGADGSPWPKLRHWTLAMCTASSSRRLLVEVRNCVLNANIKKQNRGGFFGSVEQPVCLALGTRMVPRRWVKAASRRQSNKVQAIA